jgi:hypothetical protein
MVINEPKLEGNEKGTIMYLISLHCVYLSSLFDVSIYMVGSFRPNQRLIFEG